MPTNDNAGPVERWFAVCWRGEPSVAYPTYKVADEHAKKYSSHASVVPIFLARQADAATRASAPADDVAEQIREALTDKWTAEYPVGVPFRRMISDVLALIRPHVAGDCPEADATDYAHPAWWRGHNYTVEVFCRMVNDIIDGKKSSKGISGEPWESTKRRLFALAATASGGQWQAFLSAVSDLTAICEVDPSFNDTEKEPDSYAALFLVKHLMSEMRTPAPATAEQGEKGGA
jgi:hypothetical protein